MRIPNRRDLAVPVEVTMRYLVSTRLSLMTCWLDRNMPWPPEKMVELFRTLTCPPLEAALASSVAPQAADEAKDGAAADFYALFVNPFCFPGQ